MLKLITFMVQLLLLLAVATVQADELKHFGTPNFSVSSTTANPHQFLPADSAFQLLAQQKDQELTLRFTITPEYYLYKDRFKFQVKSGNVIIGQAFYSDEAEWKDDAEFGRVQVFHSSLTITLPVQGNGELQITWQGCADAGLCYPPQSQTVNVSSAISHTLSTVTSTTNAKDISIPIPTLIPTVSYDLVDDESSSAPTPAINTLPSLTEQAPLTLSPTPADAPTAYSGFDLTSKPLLALLSLWALGLGLAFTPCVLPMLPIVAGIVARQHASNARQGFFLAFAYGIGVASSYALLGALISLFGSQANISVWLQQPVILAIFSALFVLLALASFDVFHLQLPHSWQHRLDTLSQKGKAGSFIGTWLMGFFSALVVSPCVSAPLAGVLLSVSTLGNPLLGAAALFSLGLGLSTPLMILGASEGRYLPKAGVWLNRVKQMFGVLLLAVAVILLSRIVNDAVILLLWAALSVGSGFWLHQWQGKWRLVWRSAAYILLIWGAALLVGAAAGSHNPLQPLDFLAKKPITPDFSKSSIVAANQQTIAANTPFQTIHNAKELDAAVQKAYSNNQRVLVDFYADWCISCKIIDRDVFANPAVQTQLKDWVLLRADITQNSFEERALLQRFQIFGPPAILFFEQGIELTSARIVGEISQEQFSDHVKKNFPAQ